MPWFQPAVGIDQNSVHFFFDMRPAAEKRSTLANGEGCQPVEFKARPQEFAICGSGLRSGEVCDYPAGVNRVSQACLSSQFILVCLIRNHNPDAEGIEITVLGEVLLCKPQQARPDEAGGLLLFGWRNSVLHLANDPLLPPFEDTSRNPGAGPTAKRRKGRSEIPACPTCVEGHETAEYEDQKAYACRGGERNLPHRNCHQNADRNSEKCPLYRLALSRCFGSR
jgi:hypothetical protein